MAAPLSALWLAACVVRPYEYDPVEVNARYALEFKQPCNSWLKSPRTGYRYCASPAFYVDPPLPPVMPEPEPTATDEATLVAFGAKKYAERCAICHGADGKGQPGTYPPLAGSGEFMGDPKNHANLVVDGLSGEITVQGVKYNNTMPPQGAGISDYALAAILTFERNSWGNDLGVVLPEDVKAAR